MTTRQPSARELYALVMAEWGGATLDRDGSLVDTTADLYAASLTDHATLTIPDSASYAQFVHALDQARARFADSPYLGIFHDSDARAIEFDGAVVTDRAGIDALYRAGYDMPGGAYSYRTGNGYWPARESTSAVYNTVPETRGTSRTRGLFDGATGRDAEDAAKLAAYRSGEEH